MEKFYTCEEVAALFNVKKETVYTWVREKKLSAVKTGKHYRISEQALNSFTRSRATA